MSWGETVKADKPISRRKRRILRADLHRGPNRQPPAPPPAPSPEIARIMRRLGYRRPTIIAPGKIKHVCLATTRRDTPCMALALANGRCRHHGGLSTGPKTAEGWERTRAGYRAWRERQGSSPD
jgi:hypothetical protein